MGLGTILIVILILCLVGGMPVWGYHSYGWGPSGGVAFVVLIAVVVLLAMGRL